MTNTESRLDRIERVLDALASNFANEMDARLALREDIEIVYQIAKHSAETADRTTEAVDRMVESQQALQSSVDSLSRSVAQLVENAESDRRETRRIWEYLESQQRHQGNGHGKNNDPK